MPDTQTSQSSSTANKNIPVELIRHLIETKGLTQQQTANQLGCHHSNISRQVAKYDIGKKTLKLFNDAKIDILDSKLEMILNAITPEKVKKTSAYQLTGMANYFHQMVRLESDQSTENVAYADMVKVNRAVTAKIEAFKARYGIQEAEIVEDSVS